MKPLIQAPSGCLLILNQLKAAGFEAFLVGGCVRDALLNREPKDWDIVSSATIPELMELFPHARTMGKAFGVVSVRDPELGFIEVASFREDGEYLDARHPENIRYSDQAGDSKRRDFTVNALYWDPIAQKDIVDLVKGLEDIQKKQLRCVGNPQERFREDRLRTLRALRLSVELNFSIESKTWKALFEFLPSVKSLVSWERTSVELQRAVRASQPHLKRVVLLFKEARLLENLFESFDRKNFFSISWDLYQDESYFWTSLKENISPNDFKFLKLEKTLSSQIQKNQKAFEKFNKLNFKNQGQIRAFALEERLNSTFGFLKMKTEYQLDKKRLLSFVFEELNIILQRNIPQHPLVNGDLLKRWGLPENKRMGEILQELYYFQLEEKFKDQEGAKLWLKHLL